MIGNTSMPDIAAESKGDVGTDPQVLRVKDVLGQPGQA
jgi:hypothetical protein